MINIKQRAVNANQVDALVAQGCSPLLAQLYAARGVLPEQVQMTEMAHLLKPEGLKGYQAMAEQLADAIQHQASILIIGDYRKITMPMVRQRLPWR